MEEKVSAKSDGDLTMKEVLDRVKNELSQQYNPIIDKFKEDLSVKDMFYQRELEK
jgi:hypothetical protein